MIDAIERAFHKMGARVAITSEAHRRWNGMSVGDEFLSLNVRRDSVGEYFTINNVGTELTVLDVQPKDRHLLLMSREGKEKHKFLLGHDERHWFVAGIPESKPVSNVRDAKLALKPDAVVQAEIGIKTSKRDLHRNKARQRQGEWFFVPDRYFMAPKNWKNPVLKNEPISRGRGSKPHICQELYRSGGETVYVSGSTQLTEDQYTALNDKDRRSRNWTMMKRDMDVWVKGTIRHPDHATLVLTDWCRVYSNTEHLSYAMRNIRFLD